MGLVQGRDVWGLVVEEERLMTEQKYSEEEQVHAQKDAKNVK
jgi:hypothetical protein